MIPTFADIQRAQALLQGVILKTPTIYSPIISRLFNTKVFLKLESFQETGSFKERGAYIKLKGLSNHDRRQGVIAASKGNHAQAVAFHAQALHIPATIVMPVNTPPTKVGHTEEWGARIILAGKTFEEANSVAQEIARKEKLTLIHPYDDPELITGQGTIAIEMLEDHPELDVLIVPIGGGGLCAGLALAAKSLKPSLQVYGVEVEGYASMSQALYKTKDKKESESTLADGIAVKHPGKLPQAILKGLLRGIEIVTEEEIEHAVDILARKANLVVEGAGAAGIAALLHNSAPFKRKNVGIIITGGNIGGRILSSLMVRGQLREGSLTLLRLDVEDIPGVLEKIAGAIARHQGNILEVKHQRLLYEIPIKMAEIEIMLETRGKSHLERIMRELKSLGFTVRTSSNADTDLL
ncbi:MAG: threonine ammonia-lyase [Alphaproteobacteria bacterium]|nr:threonine ammonia-lyase [Alphaproteobacteria bacterium]